MAINEQDYAGYATDPRTGRRHEIRHLPEQDCWEEGIYQTEQGDFFIGGINGLDNLATNQLANRTLYLKNRLNEVASYTPATYAFSIPAEGWQDNSGAWACRLAVTNENIRSDAPTQIAIAPECQEAASLYGLSPIAIVGEGTVTIFSKRKPMSAISGSLTVFISRGGSGATAPIATTETLGVVRVGNGLAIQADGTLSVPGLSDADGNGVPDAVDGVLATSQDIEDILNAVYGDEPPN